MLLKLLLKKNENLYKIYINDIYLYIKINININGNGNGNGNSPGVVSQIYWHDNIVI